MGGNVQSKLRLILRSLFKRVRMTKGFGLDACKVMWCRAEKMLMSFNLALQDALVERRAYMEKTLPVCQGDQVENLTMA